MFDSKVINAFLENQLQLYPEEVAETPAEAQEYLEEICAVVADSIDEVQEYLEDVGVDTEGFDANEIDEMSEIIKVGDGRFLILEV